MIRRRQRSRRIKGYGSSVMPFGISSAPATFERLEDSQVMSVYLDNMIMIDRTFQQHLLNLWKVFQRFREAHLMPNPEKRQLFQKEIWYLRHIMLLKGITTNPEKLKAIREWLTPKNKQEIRSFLGLCTYYRRFISGFANIVKLLIKLMEEQHAFQWTPEV
jgi:hypothetical protein